MPAGAPPYMESGATGALYFRNAGIPVYGLAGLFAADEDIDRLHGRDERIAVSAFRTLVCDNDALLAAVAGFTPPPGTGGQR